MTKVMNMSRGGNPSTPYRVASLFSGGGGTDTGILGGFDFLGAHYERLNTQVVYANDMNPAANLMYSVNFKHIPDERSVLEVLPEDLPEIDILTGGFPCQSFSITNGGRLGVKDARGQLFFEMVRLLKAKQPKAFIAENVKGLLSANKGQALPLILSEFSQAGYHVAFQVLKAVDFGVPQKRERVILVGIRDDLGKVFEFPEPLGGRERTIQEILEPESTIPKNCYFSPSQLAKYEENRRRYELGELSIDRGRIQDLDQPCNTVIAKTPSLQSTTPVFRIAGRIRQPTPRESARLQSFPDSYVLIGSDSAKYAMIGNAVPPVLAWYITRALINQLDKEDDK